jgi:predicted transcriptional regulator
MENEKLLDVNLKSNQRQKILQLVRKKQQIRYDELCEELGLNDSQMEEAMVQAILDGVLDAQLDQQQRIIIVNTPKFIFKKFLVFSFKGICSFK